MLKVFQGFVVALLLAVCGAALSQETKGVIPGSITVTSSIQAAYNKCPSTGGVVYVPAGYAETLTADLTLNKAYCGLVFQGTATLTMGANHIVAGSSVDGVFMRGLGDYQSSITGTGTLGVNIVCATTSGACVSFGNSAQRTNYHTLANVVVDMRAASAGTQAVNLTRTIFWSIDHVTLAGGNGNNTGLEVDGTAADFGGFGQIISPQIRNFQKGIVTTGAANSIQMIGGLVDCNNIASSVGLTRDGTLTTTGGFILLGTELSTCTTGSSLISAVTGDDYFVYTENNTTDISAGAGTFNNTAKFTLSFTQSNSGTNNDFQKIGSPQGTALSVRGVTGNAGAAIADIVAASDGNVLRRSGTSVGFGPISLATANAISGQLLPANGGTGSNLSATGGTSQVLKQTSVGGNVTVAQLAASDLSNGVTGSGAAVLATSPSLVTPSLGVAAGTSLALNGCTLGANDICTTGTALFGNNTTVQKNQNANTTFSLINTDTTNTSSRATFVFQGGTAAGRFLAISGGNMSLGTTNTTNLTLQVNNLDQVQMDGTTVIDTVQHAAPSYKIVGGATKLAWSGTAPTVSSGFCTSPSISANNGTAAFTVTIGSACAASTGVLTMPTASVGWACNFRNVTNNATSTPSQTASTVTTVSVTNYVRTTGVAGNWTASDVIVADCTAY